MRSDPTLLANRFQIDSLIAEGGMAKVFKGTDRLLGRTVAVKVLSAHLSRDPSFVARFRREAMAAASLSHSNVVGVFDTGSDGDFHYIVMEYIAGQTLAEVLSAEAPLDSTIAAGIAASACEALAVAHNAGIVHRDIKPGNIMIDAAGVVKVMDFGIAKTSSDGLTQVGSILGTVAYLSPEQAMGDPVDRRSDLFSLGCVLFEMLTGTPPITGETLMEVAHKLTTYNPPPPSRLNPQVPAAMDTIVARAMAKSPSDRFQNAQEMRQALKEMVPEGLVAAPVASRTKVLPAVSDGAITTVQRAPDRTRVIAGGAAPRRSRRFGLLVAGVFLLSAAAVALLSNMGDGQTVNPDLVLPGQTTTPQTVPSSSPSPPEPPVTQPPTTVPQAPVADPRGSLGRVALAGIRTLLTTGEQSGGVSQRAARDVTNDLDQAQRQIDDGDYQDAAGDLRDAQQEVAKYLEKGEIEPAQAALLSAALARTAQVLTG